MVIRKLSDVIYVALLRILTAATCNKLSRLLTRVCYNILLALHAVVLRPLQLECIPDTFAIILWLHYVVLVQLPEFRAGASLNLHQFLP